MHTFREISQGPEGSPQNGTERWTKGPLGKQPWGGRVPERGRDDRAAEARLPGCGHAWRERPAEGPASRVEADTYREAVGCSEPARRDTSGRTFSSREGEAAEGSGPCGWEGQGRGRGGQVACGVDRGARPLAAGGGGAPRLPGRGWPRAGP